MHSLYSFPYVPPSASSPTVKLWKDSQVSSKAFLHRFDRVQVLGDVDAGPDDDDDDDDDHGGVEDDDDIEDEDENGDEDKDGEASDKDQEMENGDNDGDSHTEDQPTSSQRKRHRSSPPSSQPQNRPTRHRPFGSRRWARSSSGSARFGGTADYGHTGCINAMAWDETGMRLASGSDDTNVCIWMVGREPSFLDPFNTPPLQSRDFPNLGLGLEGVIRTGHMANIFSVKFAPHTGSSRLLTCAGDRQVRVFDLSLSSPQTATAWGPPLSHSHPNSNSRTNNNYIGATSGGTGAGQMTMMTGKNGVAGTVERKTMKGRNGREWEREWTVLDAGEPNANGNGNSQGCCIRILRCHTERVKRIATEDSPSVFLTCSEDGTVRQHDLRTTHPCRPSYSPWSIPSSSSTSTTRCPKPLLDYSSSGLSLYSLSVSKIRPWLFVVAGTSAYAYLHDRRMDRRGIWKDWGMRLGDYLGGEGVNEGGAGGSSVCVRKFGVPKEDGFDGKKKSDEEGDEEEDSELLSSDEEDKRRQAMGDLMDDGDGSRWEERIKERQRRKERRKRIKRRMEAWEERHVTAAKLSEQNGRELLVSYSGGPVYLFDIFSDANVPNEVKATSSSPTSPPIVPRHRSSSKPKHPDIRTSEPPPERAEEEVAPITVATSAASGSTSTSSEVPLGLPPKPLSPKRKRSDRSESGREDEGRKVVKQGLDSVVCDDDGFETGEKEKKEVEEEVKNEEMADQDKDEPSTSRSSQRVERRTDYEYKVEIGESGDLEMKVSTSTKDPSSSSPPTPGPHLSEANDPEEDPTSEASREPQENLDSDAEEGDALLPERGDPAVGDDGLEVDDNGDDDSSTSDTSEDYHRIIRQRRETASSLEPHAPMVKPLRTYGGHRNEETVKDVNFMGTLSNFVVSGSDDGNFFVWDKDTGNLEGIWEGDGSVVNVMQQHPKLPVLVVSGIDNHAKVFAPTNLERKRFSRLEQRDQIIQRNRQGAGSADRLTGISPRLLLQLLTRSLPDGPGRTESRGDGDPESSGVRFVLRDDAEERCHVQ